MPLKASYLIRVVEGQSTHYAPGSIGELPVRSSCRQPKSRSKNSCWTYLLCDVVFKSGSKGAHKAAKPFEVNEALEQSQLGGERSNKLPGAANSDIMKRIPSIRIIIECRVHILQ